MMSSSNLPPSIFFPHLMDIQELIDKLTEAGFRSSDLISRTVSDLQSCYIAHVQPKPRLEGKEFPDEMRDKVNLGKGQSRKRISGYTSDEDNRDNKRRKEDSNHNVSLKRSPSKDEVGAPDSKRKRIGWP